MVNLNPCMIVVVFFKCFHKTKGLELFRKNNKVTEISNRRKKERQYLPVADSGGTLRLFPAARGRGSDVPAGRPFARAACPARLRAPGRACRTETGAARAQAAGHSPVCSRRLPRGLPGLRGNGSKHGHKPGCSGRTSPPVSEARTRGPSGDAVRRRPPAGERPRQPRRAPGRRFCNDTRALGQLSKNISFFPNLQSSVNSPEARRTAPKSPSGQEALGRGHAGSLTSLGLFYLIHEKRTCLAQHNFSKSLREMEGGGGGVRLRPTSCGRPRVQLLGTCLPPWLLGRPPRPAFPPSSPQAPPALPARRGCHPLTLQGHKEQGHVSTMTKLPEGRRKRFAATFVDWRSGTVGSVCATGDKGHRRLLLTPRPRAATIRPQHA